MSQNGQTHFKNLPAFDHFGTLCFKGLILNIKIEVCMSHSSLHHFLFFFVLVVMFLCFASAVYSICVWHQSCFTCSIFVPSVYWSQSLHAAFLIPYSIFRNWKKGYKDTVMPFILIILKAISFLLSSVLSILRDIFHLFCDISQPF